MSMNTPPSPEALVTRDIALAATRKFFEKGITNPDDFDLSDPGVIVANDLFDKWQNQEEAKVKGDIEAECRFDLARTMFYIDAGATDPDYLDEVLSWLTQSSENVPKDSENDQRKELRKDISEAIYKIRHLLSTIPE